MKKTIVLTLCLFVLVATRANNIQVANVSTVVTGSVVQVEFDISWENSWRTASTGNWDGAWVFLKFKDNDGLWKPLRFTTTDVVMPVGYTHTFGSGFVTTIPGVGMFIHRSANGFGTVNLLNVRAGITSYPGTYDIKVFAIEMVYIPQGSFYIGHPNPEPDGYHAGPASSGQAYQVTGLGNTITFGTGATNLLDNLAPTLTGLLSSTFPTGYEAFWIMKYELSQRGFIDYFNTLMPNQQATVLSRMGSSATISSPAGTSIATGLNGNIEIVTPGVTSTLSCIIGTDADNDNVYNETTDGEWNPMGKITWPVAASFLDWAALRPMTELEYEKACRGNQPPVGYEYSWGNSSIYGLDYVITNNFENNSSANAGSVEGNALSALTKPSGFSGGLRNGIFANALSTRVSAGASYYGVMELSGNMFEFCVTTSNAAGRSFVSSHGDGDIGTTVQITANIPYWPGSGNADVNAANTLGFISNGDAGLMWKGGSGSSSIVSDLRVSERNAAMVATGTISTANEYFGIRGVRKAN